jgi:hypothetical protein
VVTNALHSAVRPATRWMRVVSRASARVMSGRMVVNRRASIHVPAPGAPKEALGSTHDGHHTPLAFRVASAAWRALDDSLSYLAGQRSLGVRVPPEEWPARPRDGVGSAPCTDTHVYISPRRVKIPPALAVGLAVTGA